MSISVLVSFLSYTLKLFLREGCAEYILAFNMKVLWKHGLKDNVYLLRATLPYVSQTSGEIPDEPLSLLLIFNLYFLSARKF